MLNKKILAAAVTAALSTNAFAAIDLDVDTPVSFVLNKELIANDVGVSAADGMVRLDNTGGQVDVTTELGFTIGANTSKYIRIDLVNATFSANLVGPDAGATPSIPGDFAIAGAAEGTNVSYSLVGGAAGDSSVIIEVSAITDLQASQVFSFTPDNIDVSATSGSSIQYRLFETATAAANAGLESSVALKNESANIITSVFASVTGDFADPATATAVVADGFTKFEDDLLVASVGTVEATNMVTTSTESVDVDFTVATTTNVLALFENYTITLGGDLSFADGVKLVSVVDSATPATSCADGGLAFTKDAETGVFSLGALSGADVANTAGTGSHLVCVTVDGETVIPKGAFTATLTTGETTPRNFEDDLGSVVYDTTTIEVPFISTFSEYNQRIYIVNNGTQDALFTISYTSEGSVTATPIAEGAAAEAGVTVVGDTVQGTAAAGEVTMLKATDIVSLSGGPTRTSAVIEVEGNDSAISATTQVVNKGTNGTDTIVLN